MRQSLKVIAPQATENEPCADPAAKYVAAIHDIALKHRPTRSTFFRRLRDVPREVGTDPIMLGQIHLVYQAAMHATRAAVYYMPHLDSPAMRKRKLQIFIDDDGLVGGDTHHYQLTRAFARMGANILLGDEAFGGPAELCEHLDQETANFVRLAAKLYARSLGPWCAVEVMSDNWLRGLAEALSTHFPDVVDEPYFAECFSQGVEERHAEESLEVTGLVLRESPELLAETVLDAKLMAEALDGVWARLDTIVRQTEQRHATVKSRSARETRFIKESI